MTNDVERGIHTNIPKLNFNKTIYKLKLDEDNTVDSISVSSIYLTIASISRLSVIRLTPRNTVPE